MSHRVLENRSNVPCEISKLTDATAPSMRRAVTYKSHPRETRGELGAYPLGN